LGAWGEIFGDGITAAAIVDRLVHHAEILSLKGEQLQPQRPRPRTRHAGRNLDHRGFAFSATTTAPAARALPPQTAARTATRLQRYRSPRDGDRWLAPAPAIELAALAEVEATTQGGAFSNGAKGCVSNSLDSSRHRSRIRHAHHLAAASAVATSAAHRWSRVGRSASRRSSASRQASSARRAIAFIVRTSILAPRSDCEERRLATRWRTHAPCRVPPAGRSRRPRATAPWVSSRSSSARICFSSGSKTRLRLTYSPQPGHVPTFSAHEKRQPQKQATSISDCLPRPAAVPADGSFGL
jgi:IstB-like ATP binding protein